MPLIVHGVDVETLTADHFESVAEREAFTLGLVKGLNTAAGLAVEMRDGDGDLEAALRRLIGRHLPPASPTPKAGA